jgi:hypothetical protein
MSWYPHSEPGNLARADGHSWQGLWHQDTSVPSWDSHLLLSRALGG